MGKDVVVVAGVVGDAVDATRRRRRHDRDLGLVRDLRLLRRAEERDGAREEREEAGARADGLGEELDHLRDVRLHRRRHVLVEGLSEEVRLERRLPCVGLEGGPHAAAHVLVGEEVGQLRGELPTRRTVAEEPEDPARGRVVLEASRVGERAASRVGERASRAK